METLTIAIIVITLTVILFSSISYSYVSPDPNAQVPIDLLNTTGKLRSGTTIQRSTNQINNVGKVNPSAPTYALFNLPEKDEYMTADLRNQIDTLRTQYYYDNCQQSTVQRIPVKNNIKPITAESQLLVHPKGARVMDSRSSIGVYDKSAPHGATDKFQDICSKTDAQILFENYNFASF